MKILKTLPLIAGSLLLSCICYSQESRTIRLNVSDTVTLKTTQIIYEITIGNGDDYLGLRYSKDKEEVEALPPIPEITKMLDKEKFKYSISPNDNYTIAQLPVSTEISVVLPNEAELTKLVAVFKNQKGVTGKIKDVKYESMDKYRDNVYASLYAKATKQAGQLAKLSGNTVGKLIAVSNAGSEGNSWYDLYKQMIKEMPYSKWFANTDISRRTEEVQMTFVFELK